MRVYFYLHVKGRDVQGSGKLHVISFFYFDEKRKRERSKFEVTNTHLEFLSNELTISKSGRERERERGREKGRKNKFSKEHLCSSY